MIRRELENRAEMERTLAELKARRAARPSVVDVTPPGWVPDEVDLPERDQAHRSRPLEHHVVPNGSRASGAAEVRLPAQAPQPMGGPGWQSFDPRGFSTVPQPRSIVKDVTTSGAGATSPTDARFKALEGEIAALRRQIIQGAGSVLAEPVAASPVDPVEVIGISSETLRARWAADAYASAKASAANADGSGFGRSALGVK